MICDCQKWKDNIAKVDAPFVLSEAMNPGFGGYKGAPFDYCPWCGKPLQFDDRSRATSGAANNG